MVRFLADLVYIALVVVGHLIALPLFLWRAIRQGAEADSRAYRAALLWDLMIAELLGAPPGQTVSTWMAAKRPEWLPCIFCRLLDVRWRGHCDDAARVEFIIRRR